MYIQGRCVCNLWLSECLGVFYFPMYIQELCYSLTHQGEEERPCLLHAMEDILTNVWVERLDVVLLNVYLFCRTGFKCENLKIVNCEFFPRLQSLKRNIKYITHIDSRLHTTNAIIKNAISSKSRKCNHLTTHLRPVLRYTYIKFVVCDCCHTGGKRWWWRLCCRWVCSEGKGSRMCDVRNLTFF